MTLWVDAQLPPDVCCWLADVVGVEAVHVRDLGLLRAADREIFDAARAADVTVMTKDRDFVDLLARMGAPPHVIWIRLGNTSNENPRDVLGKTLGAALELVRGGEVLVEITQRGSGRASLAV